WRGQFDDRDDDQKRTNGHSNGNRGRRWRRDFDFLVAVGAKNKNQRTKKQRRLVLGNFGSAIISHGNRCFRTSCVSGHEPGYRAASAIARLGRRLLASRAGRRRGPFACGGVAISGHVVRRLAGAGGARWARRDVQAAGCDAVRQSGRGAGNRLELLLGPGGAAKYVRRLAAGGGGGVRWLGRARSSRN